MQPLSEEAMSHGSANIEDGAGLDIAVNGWDDSRRHVRM
jgi:hypothetical protein